MPPTAQSRPRSKRIAPAHFKRRRAEDYREALDSLLSRTALSGLAWPETVSGKALLDQGVPEWTAGFKVKRARFFTHFAVWAMER